ncbi:MAG: hypothetical protein IJ007_06560 [Oscillospiraceae bacterium]|nr:hypothetical protein [Oscillospiraceae bacterium]
MLEEWRKKLKTKPVRYWSRIEIEEIVKEKNIDRKRFYEYSKNKYRQIINRFYYSFVEHKNENHKERPQIELSYLWLHFRKELNKIYHEYASSDWEASLYKIKERLEYDWKKKIFLILSDGWVYEGYIDEILSVLAETDGIIEDFYIVTPEYDKFAVYCSDGDCILIFEK